jgi:hypothetical protein
MFTRDNFDRPYYASKLLMMKFSDKLCSYFPSVQVQRH